MLREIEAKRPLKISPDSVRAEWRPLFGGRSKSESRSGSRVGRSHALLPLSLKLPSLGLLYVSFPSHEEVDYISFSLNMHKINDTQRMSTDRCDTHVYTRCSSNITIDLYDTELSPDHV